MQMQTFTRNGVTVTFPAGYANVEAYLATLRHNLQLVRGPAFMGSKNKAKQEFGRVNEARNLLSIAEVESALA